MAFFGKKRRDERARPPYQGAGMPPIPPMVSIESRDFRIYKRKIEQRITWYERLASACEKMIKLSFDKKTEQALASAIEFTGLRITPMAPFSVFFVMIISFSMGALFLFGLGLLPSLFGVLLSMVLGLLVGYYMLRYPINLMRTMRIKASSQVVLAVLYMVVSMRISPNLERALKFTASNIPGILAWDMRRLLWDIEMGKYYSANEALTDYIAKWKPENEEFSEALRLVRESQRQIPERAEKTLDEALRVVLDGTKDRMKRYAQDLQMPVNIILMMGIILPILGYDILLPVILLWFINNTLGKRPVTFSEIDISRHPELPPKGTYLIRAGKSRAAIPVLPVAILVGLIVLLPAIYYFTEHPDYLVVPQVMKGSVLVYKDVIDPDPILSLTMSMVITMGFSAMLVVFFFLSNIQRSRIEESVYKMESEFELALFQLGNRISGGTPLEMAVEKAREDVKDLEIANLFDITLRNMKSFGMTFESALMHPKVGALQYYPSSLIRNVMKTVTDTAKRGVQYASESMLTVSRYLKSVRETQEYIRDLMSETMGTMRFMAFAMAPMVTGLVVSMSQIIIQVLGFLGRKLNEVGFQTVFGVDASKILGNTTSLTATMFQLIAGVYLMEVALIIAIFVTKISRGDDKVAQWYLAGKMLAVGIMIYILVTVGSSIMFGGMIKGAVEQIGG